MNVPKTSPGVSGEHVLLPNGPSMAPSASRSWRHMLAWGLVWAVIGIVVLNVLGPSPWPLQPSRAADLRASLTVVDRGGPALLGYHPSTHTPYSIGYSDDQGVYVIVPALSHWLGISDPITTLRWLWLGAWGLTLLFSAIVFQALFRSRWAGLLVPPVLLVSILACGFGDIYWVSAWVVVTFLPLLVLLLRSRPRLLAPALVAIALTAGIVTTIRSDSGLPVAVAAAVVAALAGGRWTLRMVVVALIVAAYLMPASVVLPAIRDHRDHRVAVDLSAGEPTSHPLWHSLYIGLGYTSNRFGIHYADGYAAAAAQQSDPGVRYLSSAYASALHRQIDALISHDAGFIVRAEAQKADVELAHTGRYLLLLALLLPGALAACGAARLRWREIALFAPAIAIGALPAIVAVPFRDYELGLLGSLGALGLLALGSVAAQAQEWWEATQGATRGPLAHTQAMLRELVHRWPLKATRRALLLAVVLLVPVFLIARHFESEHAGWDATMHGAPKVLLAYIGSGAARSQP